MNKAINLSHVYSLRDDFTLIGLTGRTGSGSSQVAAQLAEGFGDGKKFEEPISLGKNKELSGFKHNSYRKYRIIYGYAKVNFKPFKVIKYRDILTVFLLTYSFEEFVRFLNSAELKNEFSASKLNRMLDFDAEITLLTLLKDKFEKLSNVLKELDFSRIKENNKWDDLYDFYFSSEFSSLSNEIHDILKKRSLLNRNKTLQIVSNNLRRAGNPYNFSSQDAENIFVIVDLINNVIKSYRKKMGMGQSTKVVVDSLRNPLEIMFFKQRYAAFYTIAVNRDDQERDNALIGKYTMDDRGDMETFIKEEYKGGKDSEFYKQKVEACIQQADIHITFLEAEPAKEKNQSLEIDDGNSSDHTSPYYSWGMQLLKYVSLISHPGLVTPSPEERCMQLAYTAKHNSGCISRHVGAAITDEFYSVKAIGWNNTPEGQVPCVLRNAEDLINYQTDMDAFTPYEKKDKRFRKELIDKFETQIRENKENLRGRNPCFCFKALKNSCSEGKNQVHTRSLHAEESAFLQISKYGGVGIKGGKLFTTASPCELCAKKAYQLGIKVIYYVDPYPGISKEHILETGRLPIEIRLFNGAIGNAYHWLYDPMMAYKDEMTLLLGHEIKDLTSQYEDEIAGKDKEILELRARLAKMGKPEDV